MASVVVVTAKDAVAVADVEDAAAAVLAVAVVTARVVVAVDVAVAPAATAMLPPGLREPAESASSVKKTRFRVGNGCGLKAMD